MLWTGQDWTIVIAVAVALAARYLTDWKWLKKHDPKLIKELPKGLATVADDAGHIISGLLKSPWFASEAATGKVEVRHITDKLLSSHLAAAAADAIASFGKDFGDMTEGEKGTAIEMVQAALKAFGQDVPATQAVTSLHQADVRKAKLQPTAEAATARSQALAQEEKEQSVAPTAS